MTPTELPADALGLRGTTTRATYLIERFQVAYSFGGGWTCACREFQSQDSCRHTREADGRRTAQNRIVRYLAQPAVATFAFDQRSPARPGLPANQALAGPARRRA